MKKKRRPTNLFTHQVRIIGGAHRRRLIGFIDHDGLRPTSDRLRETLFNWLSSHTSQAQVLDMCAGSGALGFEALSRGAIHTTFIEPSAEQCALLTNTAATLKLSNNVHIIHAIAQDALPTLTGQIFDIVFIDPPYALNLWQVLLDSLMTYKLIDNDSLIYIESDKPLDTLISDRTYRCFTILKSTKVGQAHAYLLSLAK